MTDTPPQEGTPATPAPQEGDSPPDDSNGDGNVDQLPQWAREAIAKANREAANYRTKAQANAQAVKELDQLKQASMSELEKAVDQARKEARLDAMREAGGRLAAAEVRAAAAGRLSDEQIASLLEGLNFGAFLTEDGDVDAKRIAKFVDGIAPKPAASPGFPDLGQGARGATNGAGDMNSLIRRQLGR